MSRGEDIRDRIPSEYEKTPGYLIYDITEAVGQELDEQDAEISSVRLQLNVDNLTGDDLEKFIAQRKGIVRKSATYATGVLSITGNGTITEGDLFETALGVQFEALETKTITVSGIVNIAAVLPGNASVVGANTITQMPVTIEGIVSCTNEQATAGGYDAETDDELRQRYYIALQTPTNGANKAQYRQWALQVPGVGDAKVFPLGHGNGTVDVVIIDSNMETADTTLVTAVQTYIDPNSTGKGEGVAMVGAKCYVSSATALNISVTGKLTIAGVQEEVKARVEQKIKKYLASIAFENTPVSFTQVVNAILDADGVLDLENCKVNNGTANISVAERQVAVLNEVVFTYA